MDLIGCTDCVGHDPESLAPDIAVRVREEGDYLFQKLLLLEEFADENCITASDIRQPPERLAENI